jgi:hypothetical protein
MSPKRSPMFSPGPEIKTPGFRLGAMAPRFSKRLGMHEYSRPTRYDESARNAAFLFSAQHGGVLPVALEGVGALLTARSLGSHTSC